MDYWQCPQCGNHYFDRMGSFKIGLVYRYGVHKYFNKCPQNKTFDGKALLGLRG